MVIISLPVIILVCVLSRRSFDSARFLCKTVGSRGGSGGGIAGDTTGMLYIDVMAIGGSAS